MRRRKCSNGFLLWMLKLIVVSMFGTLMGIFGIHLVTTHPQMNNLYNEVLSPYIREAPKLFEEQGEVVINTLYDYYKNSVIENRE